MGKARLGPAKEVTQKKASGQEPVSQTSQKKASDESSASESGSKTASPRKPEKKWITETIAKLRDRLSPARSKMSTEDVFKKLDGLDKADNTLSRAEFDKMVLTYDDLKVTKLQLQELFSFVNASGSGSISYKEFKEHFGSQ